MKTKALISFAATTKLICVFVFANAKSRFSHDAAQILSHLIILIDKIKGKLKYVTNIDSFVFSLSNLKAFKRSSEQTNVKLVMSSGFPIGSDTNPAVQLQKVAGA